MAYIVMGVIAAIYAAFQIVIISLLMGFPVMWLWNALLPEIFGVKHIGFWQALGLNLLCGFLFKGSSSSK